MATPKARKFRTLKERAQADLDVVQRRYDRALKAVSKAVAAHAAAEAERDEVAGLLAYAKDHPALREDPTLPLEPAEPVAAKGGR